MARKTLNIGLIGQAFMGRAHSNAWGQVARFFDVPLFPVLHTICARNRGKLDAFARRWGYLHATTDWKDVVADGEIDLVDVGAPNNMHKPMSIAAMEAGKAVACEKPLAGTFADAREMHLAARRTRARTFVWYNYRRCPAVALAHKLVRAGRLGAIRHVRAIYLQDWATPEVPLAWRFQKPVAGAGALGDLLAHIVDMMRFVTGEEITDVCGAVSAIFVKERRLMEGSAAGGLAGGLRGRGRKGRVTVDDAMLFLARFGGGAVASFEGARQATGNQNRNAFEINGTKGSLRFNFERMNELEYFDATADRALQGWTNILMTDGSVHPYVSAWWPGGHLLGYEHGFTNMVYDILLALAGRKPVVPLPDFADAYETQRVLEAALIASKERTWIKVAEIK